MSASFDPPIVNPIITGFVEELLTGKGNLVSNRPPEIVTKPIVEYEDRMRIIATDKFDVAVYIAAVSFYASQADQETGRARGAMVCYLDTEVADKVFKAAGLQVPYDEDDESMLALSGTFCQMIADALKDRLLAAGYAKLESGTPEVYKNTIVEGVQFNKEQNEKQEISFFFLKHKALVIDWTLSPLPKK